MAIQATGAYSQVAGATNQAVGNVIPSATWNNIHSDLGTALTQVMGQTIGLQSIAKNILFGNGGFEIWQRGAGASANISVTASTTVYTADRWYLNAGANQASGVAAAAGLTSNSQLSCKVTRTAGQTGVTAMTFGYPLDTETIILLRNNKLNLSFYAKAGANFSSASGNLTVQLQTGTASPVKFTGGYTGGVAILNSTVILSTTTAQYTVVGTVACGLAVTQAELLFTWTPVGTAGADDSFTLDDIQLEVQASNNNTTASTWIQCQYDHVPYVYQLIDCLQHFQKTTPYGIAPAQNAGIPGAFAATAHAAAAKVSTYWRFPTTMRNTPTVTTFNPQGASANWQDVTGAVSIVAVVTATSSVGLLIYSSNVTTQNDILYIHAQADAGI